MTTALDELLRLVPPPPGRGGPWDWSATEETLGTALPQDYKDLLDAYGLMSFGDEVYPLLPNPSPYVDLARHTLAIRKDLATNMRFGDGAEYPEYVPPGVRYVPEELIFWGHNKSAFYFCWHTGHPDPAKWTIINTYKLGVGNWVFYDGTVTEYLLQWLRGELTDLQYVPYDRDDSNDGQTPFCVFYPPDNDGDVQDEGITVVVEELADTIRPEEERLQRRMEYDRLSKAYVQAQLRLAAEKPYVPGSLPAGHEPGDGVRRYGLSSTFPEPPPPQPPHTLDPPSPALAAAQQAGAISPDLQRLLELVPPPPYSTGYDWTDIEEHFGHRLPRDYTTLVDIYGRTFFANTFLISPPIHITVSCVERIPDETTYLTSQTEQLRKQLAIPRERWHPDSLPAQQELDPEEFISWGCLYTGNFHTWRITGDNPDHWPVMLISSYFRDHYTHHGTVTNLILRHLTGDLAPPELPPTGTATPACSMNPHTSSSTAKTPAPAATPPPHCHATTIPNYRPAKDVDTP